MKRFITPLLIVALVVGLVGTLWFLWSKSRTPAVNFVTETATTADITKKTVATGAIVPRQEVEIKARVSGVLSELFVEAGAMVKRGDRIGKIDVIPDEQRLSQAKSQVNSARIEAAKALRDRDRIKQLVGQGALSAAELDAAESSAALAEETLAAARANLDIVKEGQTRGSRASNVLAASTVDGMVIDVPVKIGFPITESNTFSPGTTIATVANMADMIFQGTVDESEVAKLSVGMPLRIRIGAFDRDRFDGRLEYISPKGVSKDGAIQFEIKASLVRKEGAFVRAGYSANADVVLDERKQALAIREALVQYDKEKKPFVEVRLINGRFERRDVSLGLSDGLQVEVLSGISLTDAIKVPSTAAPAGAGGPGSAPRGPRPRP